MDRDHSGDETAVRSPRERTAKSGRIAAARTNSASRAQRLRNLGLMLDSLTLPPLRTLHGERITLRGFRESDIGDRLRHPIDPEEEDGYGSSWRREWDGRRYHTCEDLTGDRGAEVSSVYRWAIEYEGHCVGSAGLVVDPDQHCASYTVGLFVAALRGRGLGRRRPG
jgi:hypothetical protein